MAKISIITLGCKQNKYESDCMERILKDEGYFVTQELEPADIYIINTCAVTKEAEKKSRQFISKCEKLNNNCKIIICGCASERDIDQFKSKNLVYSVFGTEGKQNILDYVKNIKFEKEELSEVYNSPILPSKSTTREYLKIQDGCNNFCSYCIIPYLRGRSRSRNLEDIIREAKILAKRSQEIVLTGIDISSFAIDGKPALPILMAELGQIPALIRLGSLEERVITHEFLQVLRAMPNFAPHFHLSLQSGDEEILKKMNRHYTPEEFKSRVELIRKYFPNANITTDVIVGFANETQEQFENTKKFIKDIGFSFVHIFPYSKREGTRAYSFEDLPMTIKKERVDKLEELNAILKKNYLSQFIGQVSQVLVEEKKEYYEGFTPEYIRVYLKGKAKEGETYGVKLVDIYLDGMLAKIIK